jgi:4-amino-4-deoxy-L-arabinose transferase-like glycosyltransferase
MRERLSSLALPLAGLAYFALAALIPPVEDELYYWNWAQRLQPSYYDHPPMVAYLIRLSTSVFGDTVFAIRFFSCVCMIVTVAVIAKLTRDRRVLWLILATPLFSLGGILITPDAPLLCFWACYALWLVTVLKRLDDRANDSNAPSVGWLWPAGGVLLGLGILSKYTMGTAVPCAFLAFAWEWRRWRNWLPGYVLHIAVAVAVTSPILVYNVPRGFEPLLFQYSHATSPEPVTLLQFLGFVGCQILLVGTMPLIALPLILKRRAELLADPKLRACFCLFVFPFTLFLVQAARHHAEANWPIVSYVCVWPLAVYLAQRWRNPKWAHKCLRWSFGVPVGCTILLTLHLIHPFPLPAGKDRVTRLAAVYDASRTIGAFLRSHDDGTPVFVPNYQWTSYLRYQGVRAFQIPDCGRGSHFTTTPVAIDSTPSVILFSDGYIPYEHLRAFKHCDVVGTFPLNVRGVEVAKYYLLRLSKEPPTDQARVEVSARRVSRR